MTESRSKTLEVIGKALAVAESVSYLKYRDLFDEQAGDILTALQAEGMAVVPVGPLRAAVANYADIALQDAMEEIEDNGHKIHVYRDDLFLKSMEGNGFRVIPASPYGKSVVKEKDDE